VELDETDVAILRCLQADSRLSFRDIAKAVGVSTPTVSARVSNLERSGIVTGYTVRVDPAHLNETSITLVIKTKLSAAGDVAQAVAGLPGVRRVALARGGRIVVDATLTPPADVNGLLEAVGNVPDVIDADHYITVRTLKEEPRAMLADHLNATVTCFECRGPITAEPVRRRIDGRDHFFCCRSCESLYVKRYETVKARAAKGARRR
jgi:DNA-binding Lrp family transcriptional regulator